MGPVQKSWSESPPTPLERVGWPYGTKVVLLASQIGSHVAVRAVNVDENLCTVYRTWTISKDQAWSATVDEVSAAVGSLVYERLLQLLALQQELPWSSEP